MLDGFSISGYRSFGADEVQIRDLARLNVFIGKNNCGKSNILRFLKRIGAGFDLQRGNSPDGQAKIDPSLERFHVGHLCSTIAAHWRVRCSVG